MKSILIRTLVVLWLAAIATSLVFILSEDLLKPKIWLVVPFCGLPVWGFQFILTGIVNPLRLLKIHSSENGK